MGFRFRRSVKIAPGIRLNFSKGGVSTSIGGRGATVNLSKRGTKATVGIPGSGISYSTPLNRGGRGAGGAVAGNNPSSAPAWAAVGIFCFLVLGIATCSSRQPSTPSTAVSLVDNDTAVASTPAYVAARAVNCRAEPAATGARVAKLAYGAPVAVVDHSGGWSKLQRIEGDCWVSTQFLTDEVPAAQAVPNTASAAPLDAAGAAAVAAGAFGVLDDQGETQRERNRPTSHHFG